MKSATEPVGGPGGTHLQTGGHHVSGQAPGTGPPPHPPRRGQDATSEDVVQGHEPLDHLARIDDRAQPGSFLLYQAGKFFPLFRVDTAARTYTRLTPEVKPTLHAGVKPKPEATQEKPVAKQMETAPPEAQPPAETAATATPSDAAAKAAETRKIDAAAELAAKGEAADTAEEVTKDKPETTLRLTKKSKKVSGIPCRVVEELKGDQPVMTHCMADKARLGITEREIRTLSRVFSMARKRGLDWLGTATTDERFVSVASQDLQSKKTLQLKSVSTKPLAVGHLRVPREFKQVPLE